MNKQNRNKLMDTEIMHSCWMGGSWEMCEKGGIKM